MKAGETLLQLTDTPTLDKKEIKVLIKIVSDYMLRTPFDEGYYSNRINKSDLLKLTDKLIEML